mmetsp:Transcript_74461/g.149865  ORF Transcript_74461/g.149865 Transcript_74461/m.149865 type:complete len:348 (-) Transcript_74461:825-1868(-)
MNCCCSTLRAPPFALPMFTGPGGASFREPPRLPLPFARAPLKMDPWLNGARLESAVRPSNFLCTSMLKSADLAPPLLPENEGTGKRRLEAPLLCFSSPPPPVNACFKDPACVVDTSPLLVKSSSLLCVALRRAARLSLAFASFTKVAASSCIFSSLLRRFTSRARIALFSAPRRSLSFFSSESSSLPFPRLPCRSLNLAAISLDLLSDSSISDSKALSCLSNFDWISCLIWLRASSATTSDSSCSLRLSSRSRILAVVSLRYRSRPFEDSPTAEECANFSDSYLSRSCRHSSSSAASLFLANCRTERKLSCSFAAAWAARFCRPEVCASWLYRVSTSAKSSFLSCIR